jgi:hypothetical protein
VKVAAIDLGHDQGQTRVELVSGGAHRGLVRSKHLKDTGDPLGAALAMVDVLTQAV